MARGNDWMIYLFLSILLITTGCGLKLPKNQHATSLLGGSLPAARIITNSEKELLYRACSALRTKRNQLIFDLPKSVFFLHLRETKCNAAPTTNEITANLGSGGVAPNLVFFWTSSFTGKYFSELVTDTAGEMGIICPKILEGDLIQTTFEWSERIIGITLEQTLNNSVIISFLSANKGDASQKIFKWQKLTIDTNEGHATFGMAIAQIEERQCVLSEGEEQGVYHFEQNLL